MMLNNGLKGRLQWLMVLVLVMGIPAMGSASRPQRIEEEEEEGEKKDAGSKT